MLAKADLLGTRLFQDSLGQLHPNVRVAMPIVRSLAPDRLPAEERTQEGMELRWSYQAGLGKIGQAVLPGTKLTAVNGTMATPELTPVKKIGPAAEMAVAIYPS